MNLVKLSKTMSHALRHDPGRYGLALDAEGWTSLRALLASLRGHRRAWQQLSMSDIEAVLAMPGKQRFERDGDRIRARYGHSLRRRILKTPASPPRFLYHGTTPGAAAQIAGEGLSPMRRQYVHLSADLATAEAVARRRTTSPVLLRVRAQDAAQAGIDFYTGNDGTWMAEPIPPSFLEELDAR